MGILFIVLGILVGGLTIVGTTKYEAHLATEGSAIEFSKPYMKFNTCINIAIFLIMIGLFLFM